MSRFLLVSLLALCGCSEMGIPLEREHVVCVVIDLSESFQDQMVVKGKAHEFLMQVLNRYYREKIGSDSQIIIAQISGSDRCLLWKGTPATLRQEFTSATAFRLFLRKNASPGSRVYHSIAESAEYLATDRAVTKGHARASLFVLSDLIDNSPESSAEKERAIKAIEHLGQVGGNAGFYYCDQSCIPSWREAMQATGTDCVIEADFVRPTLPEFN